MRNDGLGIVVLAYGGGGEFSRVVDALRTEGLDGARLVVVHNPASATEARPEAPPEGELILSPANLGYTGGMNLGLRLLREEGCAQALLLTHDAALRPGCLAGLREAAARRPEFGVLGPVLLHTGTEEAFSYGGVRGRDGITAHRKAPGPAVDGISAVDWIDGGTMLLRVDALERVGDFDERFWSYCEDADLCIRFRQAGFEVGVVLDAFADQESGANKRPGAWSYLTIRNGAACAARARGRRGQALFIARAASISAMQMLRAGLRGAGLRRGSAAEPWALAVGGLRGLLDYARGSWGPPPPNLPGLGDIRSD